MSSDPERRHRFEQVADTVYQPLQRYLGRRAAPEDAADVLGDTLLAVWRRLDDVPTDDPLPWCYGVARRCLANHRRSGARRLRLVGRLTAQPRPPHVADPADADDVDPDLHAALATLSDADREVIHLWAWEQLEPREIAVVLDTTANAVSLRLSRARARLATTLGSRNENVDQPRQDAATPGQEAGVPTPDRHEPEPRP